MKKTLPYITLFLFFTLAFAPVPCRADIPWKISDGDVRLLKKSYQYARSKRWGDAVSTAGQAEDPVIKDLIVWMQYITDYDSSNFKDITKFIRTHPDWPQQRKLEINAELLLNKSVPAIDIINWFTKSRTASGRIIFRTPLTSRGKRFLAESQILLKDTIRASQSEINILLKESWREENFTAKEEWLFLARHRDILSHKDFTARIDRLLWDGRIKTAERLLNMVNSDYQKLFIARIRLMRNLDGVDWAIDKVPDHLMRDQGLLYDRAKWRHKHNNPRGVLELFHQLPSRPKHASRWWELKRSYIRDMIDDKDYKQAYKLAAGHGLSSGASFADAEWLSGWLALRFLNTPSVGYRHFYKLYHGVTMPISLGRAAYWAGRAAAAGGNSQIAHKWYEVAANYPTSYYGQLAAAANGKKFLQLQAPSRPTVADKKYFEDNILAKASYLLSYVGRDDLVKDFMRASISHAKTTAEILLITQLGIALNHPDYTILAAREAATKGVILTETLYPVLTDLKNIRGEPITRPEKALIHSIILQESMFRQYVRSSAGALGLMQLMPATAKEVAGQAGVRYNKTKLTSDYGYNVMLGSHYLQNMINSHDGSYILAIASYNGGPGNVRKWIRKYGSPTETDNIEDIIDWVERIPFRETQNYVQRVLENLQIYRRVLRVEDVLKIEEDLRR